MSFILSIDLAEAVTVDKTTLAADIEKTEEYYNSIKDSNPETAATFLEAIRRSPPPTRQQSKQPVPHTKR